MEIYFGDFPIMHPYVCDFLFGFLLNISINGPKGFTANDSIIIMIAPYSVTFVVIFCNAYNTLKSWYIPLAITLYIGLVLGLRFGFRLESYIHVNIVVYHVFEISRKIVLHYTSEDS